MVGRPGVFVYEAGEGGRRHTNNRPATGLERIAAKALWVPILDMGMGREPLALAQLVAELQQTKKLSY